MIVWHSILFTTLTKRYVEVSWVLHVKMHVRNGPTIIATVSACMRVWWSVGIAAAFYALLFHSAHDMVCTYTGMQVMGCRMLGVCVPKEIAGNSYMCKGLWLCSVRGISSKGTCWTSLCPSMATIFTCADVIEFHFFLFIAIEWTEGYDTEYIYIPLLVLHTLGHEFHRLTDFSFLGLWLKEDCFFVATPKNSNTKYRRGERMIPGVKG